MFGKMLTMKKSLSKFIKFVRAYKPKPTGIKVYKREEQTIIYIAKLYLSSYDKYTTKVIFYKFKKFEKRILLFVTFF